MRSNIMVAVIMAFVLMILMGNNADAAYFRDGQFLTHKGILESMRLEPRLPAAGESFKIRLTGSWPPVRPGPQCPPPLEIYSLTVDESGTVFVTSRPEYDAAYCDQAPASWNLEVTIPANAWDIVDENGFLHVEHRLFSGIHMLTDINQDFDMRLGTHEVPAYIGSGFWISEELPNEGILVEQQGNRVLFYGLGYNRDPLLNDEGEPVWQLVAGEMYGNSTLGRSYRFDWPYENNMPLENPTEKELITLNDSGAIIVDDYNHIRAFTEEYGLPGYHDYKRILFGLDGSRLPAYVPPLGGRWTLHGFEGRTALFTDTLEFTQGKSQGSNQYQFTSTDGDWLATCTVVAPGTGDCTIVRASDGTKLGFPLTAFQGNLARGSLGTGENNTLDGVLVRDPWKLPVLDNQ